MNGGRGPDKKRRKRRRYAVNMQAVDEPDQHGHRLMRFFVADRRDAPFFARKRTDWQCRFDGRGNVVGRVEPPDVELRRAHREAARDGAKFLAREATKQLGLFDTQPKEDAGDAGEEGTKDGTQE